MLAREVAVGLADRKRRRDGEVRNLRHGEGLDDEMLERLGVGHGLAKVGVEHRAARIERLELVLVLQGVEHVARQPHRQGRRIGVVRRAVARGLDVRVKRLVDLGQPVARALGRGWPPGYRACPSPPGSARSGRAGG